MLTDECRRKRFKNILCSSNMCIYSTVRVHEGGDDVDKIWVRRRSRFDSLLQGWAKLVLKFFKA
jgi:hypothetical protein